jgi:3,4-dihydroxy 2-butanone 4-phosphate synthase/GTP cyclohydrolase II
MRDDIAAVASAIHHTKDYGDFVLTVFSDVKGREHVALSKGDIASVQPVLCRISSECTPGIVLNSAQCDCEEQLNYSLAEIAKAGVGLLIYTREEGRGHGLTTKIRALTNVNSGMDTFEAVEALSLPADVRTYAVEAAILRRLCVTSVRLLTNNPEKSRALISHGIEVADEVSIPVTATAYSAPHLRAKAKRGHIIRIRGVSDAE